MCDTKLWEVRVPKGGWVGGGGGVPGASWSPIWPPSRDVFAMEPGANVIEPESPENVI